jgi:hypothetical protein
VVWVPVNAARYLAVLDGAPSTYLQYLAALHSRGLAKWLICKPRRLEQDVQQPMLYAGFRPDQMRRRSPLSSFLLSMRTAGMIVVTIAALSLAVVLIAPNVELDDYQAQPRQNMVAALTWLFLLTTSVRNYLHLGTICGRPRRGYARPELWPRSALVVTAPPVLTC